MREKYFLPGTEYLGSNVEMRCLKAAVSTAVAGIMSLTKKLVRALVMSLYRLDFVSYGTLAVMAVAIRGWLVVSLLVFLVLVFGNSLAFMI